MRAKTLPGRTKGYTLLELVIVIFIFSMVMTLISLSFNKIVASSSQITRSAETDIGALIGLELLRIDLGFAGFGLPWALNGASYSEAASHLVNGNPDTDAASFNDSPNGSPRALVMMNDKGLNGSDYLVLKGTALGMKTRSDGGCPARGWSYLNYSSTGAIIKPSKSEVELAYGKGDRVIILNSGVRGGVAFRDLVTNGSTFSTSLNNPLPDAFKPKSRQDSYLVYGISPAPDSKNGTSDIITFPFNRVDYYLDAPGSPSLNCAKGTGTLYRGQVNQSGRFSPLPLLECVADLQVVFLLNTSNDGSLMPTNDIGAYSADQLRNLVTEVRVYILAQQGKKDPAYNYPVTDPSQAIVVGDQAKGIPWNLANAKVWSQTALEAALGKEWLHYHWKVFTIAVQPKNLN